ncbi:UBA-like domain DUF1421 - like 2 [Theobroma cacao]|nr:UBA-like domain DUF1421 - like 2 [Theobroma cacao]
MEKRITQLPKSRNVFFDDDDDEYDVEPQLLHSSNFRPIPTKHTALDRDTGDRGVGASSYGAALIAEIDRKIKEHTENVVCVVGGLSARVSQLESRTRQLENAVGDLKGSVEFNHGRVEGKIRELGNVLGEVRGGIHDLRDKHEIAEAKLQLAKLTLSKVYQSSSTRVGSAQELSSSVPQQSQLQVSVTCPQQLSPLPSGAAPNLLQQNTQSSHEAATPPQLPTQLPPGAFPCIPHSQSNYPLPMLTPDTTHQQYLAPLDQQMQQPIPALTQPYQPPPQLSPIPQLSQLQQQHPLINTVNSHANLPLGYQPKDVPCLPSQSIHKSSVPPAMSPAAYEYFVSSKQQIQDQSANNPYKELPSGYSQPQRIHNLNNQYPYGASSSGYNGSPTKPSQLSPSSVVGAGNSYSRLPTAKILPYALPTASSVDSGSNSSESGNRIRVDDVIDKVVAMGFRRDLVRATVRKLTANGQSVDLNVVLDKLMNSQDV